MQKNTDLACFAKIENLFLTVQFTSLEKIHVFLPMAQVILAASNDNSTGVSSLCQE